MSSPVLVSLAKTILPDSCTPTLHDPRVCDQRGETCVALKMLYSGLCVSHRFRSNGKAPQIIVSVNFIIVTERVLKK